MSKKAMVSRPMASDERLSDAATRLSDVLEYCEDMERALARAELVQRRTARHLRQERKRRRIAERDALRAEELNRVFWGCEGGNSVIRTPVHYRGDGYVTCRRAMESAASQEKVVEPTPMEFYWWACAFKYVWRCWSKEDSESDMRKAIDCLRKCMKEVADG